MSQSIQVNGQTINYPETGDTNWADDATNFAIQTSAALGKIGLSSGTSVDITQTLDVTGNTTLDANLSVGGNASVTGNTTLTGNLTVNGNTQLGNTNTDTIGVTGIVNVDSGVLYVDPVNNRVGINDTTPSEALDVTGNVAITGNETVGGTLGVIGNVAINTNKFNITASSGDTKIAGTLEVTGNTTLTSTLLNSNGTESLPSISFSGDSDTGLYNIGANELGITSGGSNKVKIGSYGLYSTGHIVQIVSTVITNTFSATPSAGSWTAITGLSVSITPKFTNSSILIMAIINGASANQCFIRLARNGTAIAIGDASSSELRVSGSELFQDGNTYSIKNSCINFQDSPASTSLLTYSIEGTAGGVIFYINRSTGSGGTNAYGRSISSITAYEIGG